MWCLGSFDWEIDLVTVVRSLLWNLCIYWYIAIHFSRMIKWKVRYVKVLHSINGFYRFSFRVGRCRLEVLLNCFLVVNEKSFRFIIGPAQCQYWFATIRNNRKLCMLMCFYFVWNPWNVKEHLILCISRKNKADLWHEKFYNFFKAM